MSVPPDEVREAPGTLNAQGQPIFEWRLTDQNLTDPVRLILPPMNVLPVIFVPGIMGSNLMDLEGNPVWRLNTTVGRPVWLLGKMYAKGAGTRQRLMHPARVRVNPGGSVPDEPVGSVFRAEQYRNERYWGEIAEGSYHSFLLWLEERLNGQGYNPARWSDFFYAAVSAVPKPGERPPEPKLHPGISMKMRSFDFRKLAEKEPAEPVMSDDLLKRAKFLMPVYACGYNWLASNAQAAEELRKRIEDVHAKNNQGGFKCEQVVLVTHSMGGHVSRCCAQLDGMQDKIAGIIHGVMPAVGAAVAYRRCKVGMFEEDAWASQVIGRNGREVTAVFAQAPGALQLLPTQEYQPRWLKIEDASGTELEVQPQTDPYQDIYLRQDRWWGLIRQEWLRPEGGIPQTWDEFERNITKTREFHDKIRGHYHPCSYVYYGAGQEQPSFETVEWHITAPQRYRQPPSTNRPTSQQVSQMGFGDVSDTGENPLSVLDPVYPKTHWLLRCAPQDGGGDGTVPISSGRSPLITATNSAHIRQQFRLTGFDHEGSFKNTDAQFATLYALQKIAGQAKVPA